MVWIHVTDEQDPTPYWLISTRHPEQLVAALDAARPAPPRPADEDPA